MTKPQYLASYLRTQYPRGRIRTALKSHKCDGWEDDPGCGRKIAELDPYYDTGRRDEFHRAGRFCKRCAMIGQGQPDLFIKPEDLEDPKKPHHPITKGGL